VKNQLLFGTASGTAVLPWQYRAQVRIGVYGDEPVIDIEGIIFFETLLLARAIDWLAMLSIDPDSEARRGTLAVFS
jgi:hypothetical protein